MNKKNLYLILVVTALIMAILACGSDNTGEKVGETGEEPASAPPKVEIYSVGEVIAVKDHTIVLNEAEFQGNILKANFTIENQGDDEKNISTLLNFSARDDEGSELEEDIFDCNPSLGGSILPGDKMKGNVCYKGTANVKSVKIYYEADLFGSGAIVWEITK